jgi:DNA-binding transcriptional LysR family regulator
LPDSTLKAKRLASDRIILVASPGYIERAGSPKRPPDIANHACLIHGEQRHWTFISGETRINVRAAGRLFSDNGAFLQTAAVQGAGLLRTSEIAILDELMQGRLIRVLPEFELGTEAAIWALYPNTRHAMPRLRAFIDHLSAFCREKLESPVPDVAAEEQAPQPHSRAQ